MFGRKAARIRDLEAEVLAHKIRANEEAHAHRLLFKHLDRAESFNDTGLIWAMDISRQIVERTESPL